MHSPTLHSALDAVADLELKGTVGHGQRVKPAGIGRRELSDYEQRYIAILQAGVEEEGKEVPLASESRGPKTQSKSQNQLDWPGEYREETLAFMKDVTVPFEPNGPNATCG